MISKEEKKALRDMAVMKAVQRVSMSHRLHEHLHQARQLVRELINENYTGYQPLDSAVDTCLLLLPDEVDRTLRALDVEPEEYDYRRDYDELRAKANGDVIDEDSYEVYKFEHPVDIIEKLKFIEKLK